MAKTSLLHSAAGATLVLVMAWGAWQVVAAVRQGLEYPHTLSDFREGRSTQAIEKQIDQKLPAREWLIAGANALRFRLMHGAADQVRLGQSDWIYLTDEVRHHASAQANQVARIDLLAQTARSLQAQGVQLLVLLVPDKARVYPQYLPEGAAPGFTQARYAQALQALRDKGVPTVDVLAPLALAARDTRQPVYYRTDTHWNMLGARVAAQAVAQAVKTMPLELPDTRFVTESSSPQAPRPGDLLRLMGLLQVPNFWRPQPDEEAATVTRQTSADVATGGLLGNAAGPPVVLVGTSYSLRGNFQGQLQEALSAKLLSTAKDGGGFLQAASDYFADEAFQSDKPKLIIWEVPERFLPEPLTQEKNWLATVKLAP
ncbi:MAG: hypothetical protein RLZZ401_2181 [Pseudomonadota bacterium]|jgi:alginate O-acetyltransferase complex protein AlgJ